MPKNRRFTGLFWAKLLKIWLYGGLGSHRKFGTTSPNSARWHHPLIGLQSTPWKSILPSLQAKQRLGKSKTSWRPPLTRNWRQMAPLPRWFPLTLMIYNNPSTSWPNSHKLAQLTTVIVHRGGGGIAVIGNCTSTNRIRLVFCTITFVYFI